MAQLQSGGRAEYSPCRDNTMSSVYAESFRKRWSAIRSAHWSLQTTNDLTPWEPRPSATPRPWAPPPCPPRSAEFRLPTRGSWLKRAFGGGGPLLG